MEKIAELAKVNFYHNGVSFILEQVRFEINGMEVHRTRILGITSSIKGYLWYIPDENYCYENACWTFRDNTSILDTILGSFIVPIPLKY